METHFPIQQREMQPQQPNSLEHLKVKAREWTDKGKAWLESLRNKAPKEVIEQIANPPKENELFTSLGVAIGHNLNDTAAEYIEKHITESGVTHTPLRMEKVEAESSEDNIEATDNPQRVELEKVEKIFGVKPLNKVYDPHTGEVLISGTQEEAEVQLQVAQMEATRKVEAFFREKNIKFPKFNGKTKQPLTTKEKITAYKEILFSNLDEVKWQDMGWLETLWPEAKAEDPLFQFLAESDTRKAARCNGENNFVYQGKNSIEGEDPEALLEDARTFYLNHLAFWENKPGITTEKVKEILGDDLYEELQQVKRQIATETLGEVQRGKGRKLVNALIALEPAMVMPSTWSPGEFRQTTVMTHGVVRPGEWNIDELRPEYWQRVQSIMDSPEGVRVNRARAGNVGAFCNPGLLAYGSALDGSKLVFFTDDLLESHASVSYAKYGDGLIIKDYQQDRAIPIPNRVLINPQAASIEGLSLNTPTTLEYILRLKNKLQEDQELNQKLTDAGLTYERTVLGEDFSQDIALLYQQLRTQGYPDAAVIGIRDYFTKLTLSSNEEHRIQAEAIKQAIHAREDAISDLRDLFPQILSDNPKEGVNV